MGDIVGKSCDDINNDSATIMLEIRLQRNNIPVFTRVDQDNVS